MDLKELNEKKESNKLLEISQSKLMFDFLKKKHKRFEFADISQRLAFEKKGEDFLFLGEALTRWHNNSKKEEQQKELLGLVQSLWRIDAYCQNIEIIVQQSVAEYVTVEKRNSELVSEKRFLELQIIQLKSKYEIEIKSLKSEIEFLNKDGKS